MPWTGERRMVRWGNHQVVILKSERLVKLFTNEYKLEQLIRIKYKCVQRKDVYRKRKSSKKPKEFKETS